MKSKPISHAEYTLILNAIPLLRDKTLFILGYYTGYRVGELLSIRLDDVVQNGRVCASIFVKRKFMKGKKVGRSVILHPVAKAALEKYIASGEVKDKLFPICRKTAWLAIKNAASAVGISGHVTTHCWRKAFATRFWLHTDKDALAVQRALGHANLSSVHYYLELDAKVVDAAILAAA